ncbi:MAG: hypothetical protein HUU09_07440 [Candidatus Jettenia caeni]|nr:hypothetical protein [Candidatus Jettenia caeni]
MISETITVFGRKIAYEIKDIDIYSLEYYPENPRINYIISRTHPEKITQEFIEQELLKLDSTKERIKDLEENKGLLDEIYVLGNKVVEGNTRLCAFRRLHKKYPDASHWRFIKARILQDGVTDEELFYILGTFHIKGKTEWDAYEKAAYIYKMIKVLKKNPEEVAKQLGKQRKTVESMLNAYEAMSKKYLINSDNVEIINGARDELKKYSYFEAFFLQKDLVSRVNEAPAFLDDFVQWVKEDRFKRAQDVRELPKILSNKKACKAFYESDTDEAFDESMHILYENKPEKVDRFYKKVREFREFLKEAEVLKVKMEIDSNKNKKAELQQCYKDLKRFCKEAGLDIS